MAPPGSGDVVAGSTISLARRKNEAEILPVYIRAPPGSPHNNASVNVCILSPQVSLGLSSDL